MGGFPGAASASAPEISGGGHGGAGGAPGGGAGGARGPPGGRGRGRARGGGFGSSGDRGAPGARRGPAGARERKRGGEGECDPFKEQIVRFQVPFACGHGDAVLVSGSAAGLGAWDPDQALPLEWSEGDLWAGEVRLPPGEAFLFKLLLRRRDGQLEWAPGDDCELEPPCYRRTYTTVVNALWEGGAEVAKPFSRKSDAGTDEAEADAGMLRMGEEVQAKVQKVQEAIEGLGSGGEWGGGGTEGLETHLNGLSALVESLRASDAGGRSGQGLMEKSRAAELALASLNSEVLRQETALEAAGGDPLSPAALAADVAIAGQARTAMLALSELEAAGRLLQARNSASGAPPS